MASALPTVGDRMRSLQMYLRNTGRYHGAVDGKYGPLTKQAVLAGMEDGPETYLTDRNYAESAARLNCKPSYIKAFAEVEANGAGFEDHRVKILFEPHIFSKVTQHRFDATNADVSYALWGLRPYPRSIGARYAQLLEAVGLDPWAAFQACSYGEFQILGRNFKLCGFDVPWAFAFTQAYDEERQLLAFEAFVTNTGLLPALRLGLWETVAARYNGTAYRSNKYDTRLADAAAKFERSNAA